MAVSGVNPGDAKKRGDWVGYAMSYPRVIPHSVGAGVIDAVGDRVDPARIGERVFPRDVSDEIGACLGIPGMTAHRAVFGDGPVEGTTVLVHGVLGGGGSIAAQLAAWRGAPVIGTVRRSADLTQGDGRSRTASRWTTPTPSRRSGGSLR